MPAHSADISKRIHQFADCKKGRHNGGLFYQEGLMIGNGTILADRPPQSVATSTNSLESIVALEIMATAIFEVIRGDHAAAEA